MKSMRVFLPKKDGGNGFTLIEMLVVVVIIGVLIAISAPAVDGMLRGSRLTSAADDLRNYLSGAQQLAVAQNVEVEVRLFESISATAVDGGAPRVRTLGTYVLRSNDDGNGAGDYLPEGMPLKLDDALAISVEPILSSLLSRPFKTDETESGRYVSFHFFPDGSTDLSPGQPWFLTILEQEYAAGHTAPANFATIQIHPASGKLRTFRP